MDDNSGSNTILIFTTRSLCYCSAAFFASRLSDAFEKMGIKTQMCELDMAQSSYQNIEDSTGKTDDGHAMIFSPADEIRLEGFIGKKYRAVIDFNSRLPEMVLDDGSYYLDHIQAPFYNYILDNPLYHHNTLSCRLHDYNVVLVDNNHCKYVRKYYPHINHIIFSVLSADKAVLDVNDKDKKSDILFPGTYRNPKEYLAMIMSGDYLCANKRLRDDLDARNDIVKVMKAMLDIMQADTGITMQRALEHILECEDIAKCICSQEYNSLDGYMFNEVMNYVYPVEMYLRNLYRKELADAFVENGVHLTVLGDWWDKYDKSDSPYISWESPVSFAMSSSKIAQYKVVADCSPFFKAGIHDRVFAGMANRTAVVTDYSIYKSQSALSQCVGMYKIDDCTKCVELSHELLINDAKRRKLVDNAIDVFKSDYTWARVAGRIIGTL